MANTNSNVTLWTKSQDSTLAHLLELGWNYNQIGGRLGKSPDAVRNRKTRLGITHPGPRGHIWTNEEDEAIRSLWPLGLSTEQMAQRLTEQFSRQYTKNGIIGRAHRLKQPPRKASPKDRKPRIRTPKPICKKWEAPPPPAEDHAFKPFGELTGEVCHFPQGETRGLETLMCGLPRAIGSYCQYHHWMTHEKRSRSRAVALEAAPPSRPPSGIGAASLQYGKFGGFA